MVSLWRLDRWRRLVVGRRVVVMVVCGGIWKKGVFGTLSAVRSAGRENILV